MNKIKNNRRRNFFGYTLIEVLVVISIIAFIATAALYVFNYARLKSKDTKRLADIEQIRKAIEIFRNENGRYPGMTSDGGYYAPDGINDEGECVGDQDSNGNDKSGVTRCGWSNKFEYLMRDYIKDIPADPSHNYSNYGDGHGVNNPGPGKYFYSYDIVRGCPNSNPQENKCAGLCFHLSESGRYDCSVNNSMCGDVSAFQMGQRLADYCVVFDSR